MTLRIEAGSRAWRTSTRLVAAVVALVLSATALTACSTSPEEKGSTTGSSSASDSFPVTITHKYGTTTIPEEPKRVVVVGLTEQDILLDLGVVPVATTEWYDEHPSATWPWAQALLKGAKPKVLHTTNGFEFEKIAGLKPDLIIGTNAGMKQGDYKKLSQIAPTVTSIKGSEPFFSDWKAQTRQVAAAVGRAAAGEKLITGVEGAYAKAKAAHPEFTGLTATFSQGVPWEDNLWVYPDGLNTDFLTDLGFTITQGLEKYAPDTPGSQARISPENVDLLDADVIVFATENRDAVAGLMKFGTLANLKAVKENRSVYTDGVLAGAIYFMTPLSQKYVLEKLTPRLVAAVKGEAPQSIDG
jgi:iron complex transport system substrate-binding protein